MLKIKDLLIKKILKSTDIIVFTIISIVFIAPFLEKYIFFLHFVKEFGYLKVVVIFLSIFFVVHSTLAYKYDNVIFEKYYSQQKIIHGLILIIVILLIIFNLII